MVDSNYGLGSLPELFQNLGQIVVCEEDGDMAMSIADLEEIVDRLCQGFVDWGAKPGDRIAVWLPNGVPYIALMWATSRLGLILVSINTRYRSSEVADIVGRSGARLLVVDPGFLGIDFRGILAGIERSDLLLEGVISLDDNVELTLPTIRWSDLIRSERYPLTGQIEIYLGLFLVPRVQRASRSWSFTTNLDQLIMPEI